MATSGDAHAVFAPALAEAAGSGASSDEVEKGSPVKARPAGVPIFMENPDGTISEAVPSTYKTRRPRLKAARAETEDTPNSSDSETLASAMFYDVEYLYHQHARAMVILLVLHFTATALYNVVYIAHMRDGSSVREFIDMYEWNNKVFAERLLWGAFAVEVGFSVMFYAIAIAAFWTQRPSWFKQLANYGITGILFFVLLAYIDKFNLLVFCLHLLTYIYARFMQGLTASLMLLPPPQSRARAADQIGQIAV